MPLLQLSPDDDVAIATVDIAGGSVEPVAGGSLSVRDDVPAGHKVALHDLGAGATVRKYGQVIGETTEPVAAGAGAHLHLHNLGMPADPAARVGVRKAGDVPPLPDDLRRTFLGIRRPDGRVATRNYVGILTTVNWSATVARKIAQRTEDDLVDGVDGVVALTHGTGCGMADRGEGWDLLRRTLAGYATHPNIGGLVVVGLGCEVNAVTGPIDAITTGYEIGPEVPVSAYTIQDAGGTTAAIAEGIERVRQLMPRIADAQRVDVGVEELVVGLQCGGSDGWSGLTANPSLGVASDWIVAQGGTSLWGETPDIYGAEHLLAARAVSPAVSDELIARIRWWEEYTARAGTSMDGNPSPGNKAGGITVAKAGRSPLSGVIGYVEPYRVRVCSSWTRRATTRCPVTGMVAGGADIICFTTGRGSVFRSRPVPTVKLATNSGMAARMAGEMDLDAGVVGREGVSVVDIGRRVHDTLIGVASGRRSLSEELGLGGEEIVPWQLGAVL